MWFPSISNTNTTSTLDSNTTSNPPPQSSNSASQLVQSSPYDKRASKGFIEWEVGR
jgi:hypothetical protein